VTLGTTLEMVLAAALIVGAVILYRRRAREDSRHGSQGAVLLLFIGIILLIHGSGLLEYRPSAAELEQ
jgi:hypothetical protein